MNRLPILRDTVLRPGRRALPHQAGPVETLQGSTLGQAGDLLRAGLIKPPGYEEGRSEGYAAGLQKGLADAAVQIAEEIDSRQRRLAIQLSQAETRLASEQSRRVAVLDGLIQAVEKAAEAQAPSLERQAIALALEALCKIAEPNAGRQQLLVDLVKKGLTHLRSNALLSVRMHPVDLAELTSNADGRALVEQRASARWTADSSLERGACLLDSDHGQLDTGLHTQLARLRKLWAEAGEGATE